MQKSGKRLKKSREYSEEFKRKLVSEYERGESTVRELSGRYQIAFQVIYRWIKRYSLYQQSGYILVEKSQSKTEALKVAESKIRDLEQLLGRKQVEVEYLNKVIELASGELGVDLKKKCSFKSSSGFDQTSQA
jgi:transposase-like protein